MSGPHATPRDAASVILVREGTGLEVFLLRRHRRASFMSSAFVFPGGAADPGEDDPRLTAARELFEEAGVLLADRPVPAETLAEWRARVHDGAPLIELMRSAGVGFALDELAYFSHWITPSAEKKRFSARFFVAALPAGQTPSFDNRETVDERWVTPAGALERAGELRLPPPQVRTFGDMAGLASVAALRAFAAERATHAAAIMPRFCPTDAGFALLLPWDPDYETRGQGDSLPWPAGHPLATGPSRFILEGTTWKNVHAPSSPSAD